MAQGTANLVIGNQATNLIAAAEELQQDIHLLDACIDEFDLDANRPLLEAYQQALISRHLLLQWVTHHNRQQYH